VLEGIRVVEMGVWVAAPAAGGVLADWCADVVKLEAPAGDPMRQMGQVVAGLPMPTSPPFTLDNRGKRSIALDLKTEDGLALARKLILGADVFLSNMRADALERLGLDYGSLSAENERLIYAHVSGYGQEGPDSSRPAYDVGAFWARTGIGTLLRPHGQEEPIGIRGGFGDHTTAMHALSGIMAALFHRERTGKGQHVDACLLRSGIYTIGWDISTQLEYGRLGGPAPRSATAMPTSACYRTSDERWIQLLGIEAARHWPPLLEALERLDLKDDERFKTPKDRRENAAELMPTLDAEFAKHTFDEWIERLDHVGVWWAPVQTPAQIVNDPQAHAVHAFTEVPSPDGGDPIPSVASPVRFSDTDTSPRGPIPNLGEHTDDVLRELGCDDAQLADLRSRGVVPS